MKPTTMATRIVLLEMFDCKTPDLPKGAAKNTKGLPLIGITPLCLVPRAGFEPARWGTTEGF
jgi:hypothetical protein